MHSLVETTAATAGSAPDVQAMDLAPRPAMDPASPAAPPEKQRAREREIGGPSGPEPTRYGDWERKGRCIDF